MGTFVQPKRRSWGAILPGALAIGMLVVAGCKDAAPGDDPDAAVSTDASVLGDATVDAAADAWTFTCPAEERDGSICFRGQVRNIITEAPVAVPAGSTMRWFSPSVPRGFPDTLRAETPVQPDGRFIFPRAPHEPVDYPDDPYWTQSYSHADLRLETTLDGSIVPDNKYGFMCPECFATHACPECTEKHPIMSFYVIPAGTFEIWDGNREAMNYSLTSECAETSLLPENNYKAVILVTEMLDYEKPDYSMNPQHFTRYICNAGLRRYPSGEIFCPFYAGTSRLDGFLDSYFSGLIIVPLASQPAPAGELVILAGNDDCSIPGKPMWGAFGDEELDSSGPVVVTHIWETYMSLFAPY